MKNKKVWVAVLSGVLALAMIVTMIAGLLATQVSAKSSSELKSELGKLEDKKDALQEEMDALQGQIDENFSEMEKITAEKNVIDQEIFLLNQQILTVNEQITTYGMLIADKQEELDTAKAHLKELNQKNKERIRAMEEDGSLSYWSVLFKANSFSDLLDRLNMIEEIAAADQRRLKEMDEAAQMVAQAQAALEEERDALEASKLEIAAMQTELEGKRAEADALLMQLNAKGDEFEAMMDEAEEKEQEFIKQIAQKEKEYNEAKKNEQANTAPAPSGNYGVGEIPGKNVVDGVEWIIPCKYVYLSSPYGWRIHPVYGYPKFHTGVDLAGPKGTPILASRAGTVTAATYNSGSGYYVTVNHGDGFSTSYLHLTHYIVSVGDTVAAGQVLGYMGSTGVSTGPHLHFTVYYNGNTVNPVNYISFY